DTPRRRRRGAVGVGGLAVGVEDDVVQERAVREQALLDPRAGADEAGRDTGDAADLLGPRHPEVGAAGRAVAVDADRVTVDRPAGTFRRRVLVECRRRQAAGVSEIWIDRRVEAQVA